MQNTFERRESVSPQERSYESLAQLLRDIEGQESSEAAAFPTSILNKENAEVIISHTDQKAVALGQVNISFDNKGRKQNISLS